MTAVETDDVQVGSINSYPLWQRVLMSTQEDDPALVLQVPDLPTARDFWNIYQPEPVALENFISLSEERIKILIPDASWYLRKEHTYSLHGKQHSLRVALYSEIIAQKVGLSVREKNILLAVSLLHDIGRENDTVDPNHGARSADWWAENRNVLEDRGIELTDEDKEIVAVLCINHERVYEDVPEWIRKDKEISTLLKYFMVADALDRYRAPNESWWPDPIYFHHDLKMQYLFIQLMPFAKYFTLATEYYRLANNKTIEEAARDIGRGIGLII